MQLRAYDPSLNAALANLVNAAWAEARALPPQVNIHQEHALLTADDVARRRDEGWLGEACGLIEANGEVVALTDARLSGENEALLGWFVTHPQYRRQGLASQCLAHTLQALGSPSGELRTNVPVDSRIPSACAFLESHGFIEHDPANKLIRMDLDIQAYELLDETLPEGYSISKLSPETVPQWSATRNAVFDGEFGVEWFEKTFSSRADFSYDGWHLLMHAGEVVGICAADLHREQAAPHALRGCMIEYVGVRSEHRGKRLGETLMHLCLNHAKRSGAPLCQLLTQPFRVPAITLYEKLGFLIVRENRTYKKSLGAL